MSMFLHVMFIKKESRERLSEAWGTADWRFLSVLTEAVSGEEKNLMYMEVYVEKENVHVIGEGKKQRRSLKRAETRKQKTFIEGQTHLKWILNE